MRCQHRSYYSPERPQRTTALKTNPAGGQPFGEERTPPGAHTSGRTFMRSLTRFRGNAFPSEAVLYPPCADTITVQEWLADLVEATCNNDDGTPGRQGMAQVLLEETGALVNPSQLDGSCVIERRRGKETTLTFRNDLMVFERWFAIVYACIDTCGTDPSTWPLYAKLPGSARAQRLLVAELTGYHPVVRTLLSKHATRVRGVNALAPEHAAVVYKRLCAAVAGAAEPPCLFPFPLPLHPPHALRMRRDLAGDWSRVLAAEVNKGCGLEQGLALGLCATQQCVDSLVTQTTKKGWIYPASLEVGYRTFVLWVGRFSPLAGEAAVPLSTEAVEIGLSDEQTEAVLAVVRGLDPEEVAYFHRLGVLLGLDFGEYYIGDTQRRKQARLRLDSRGRRAERDHLASHGFVPEEAQARLNAILDRVTDALRGRALSVGSLTPAEMAGSVRARAVPLRLPLISEWCSYTYAEHVTLHGTLHQGAAFENAIKKRVPATWEQCASNTGRYAGRPASLWNWVTQVHESILSVDPALRRATLGDRGPQIEEVLKMTGAMEFARLHASVYRTGVKRKVASLQKTRGSGGHAGLILSRAGHLIYAAVLSALRGRKEEVSVKHLEHLEQLLRLLRGLQRNTDSALKEDPLREVVRRLTAEKRALFGDADAELLLPAWFDEACRSVGRSHSRVRLPYVGTIPPALRDYLLGNARAPALLATEVVLRFAEEAGVPASVPQIREAVRAAIESALREENSLPAPAATADGRDDCWLTARRNGASSLRDAHGFPHAPAILFRKFLNTLIGGDASHPDTRRMRAFLLSDCGIYEKLADDTPPETFQCLYHCLRKITEGRTVSVSEADEAVLAHKSSLLSKLVGRLPAWVPFDERIVAIVCHDMIKRQVPQRTTETLVHSVSATLDELCIPGGAHAIRSQRNYFIEQNATRLGGPGRVQHHAWSLKAVAPSNGEFRRWLHEIAPVAANLSRSRELATQLLGLHGPLICEAVARMQLAPARVKRLTVHQLSTIHSHLALVMADKISPAQIERVERPDEVAVDASVARRMPYVGAPSLEQVVSILDQRYAPPLLLHTCHPTPPSTLHPTFQDIFLVAGLRRAAQRRAGGGCQDQRVKRDQRILSV